MIEIDEKFSVPSSAETVWAVMSDPKVVVTALPGAELGDEHDDGSFDGSLTVKFGPLRVKFNARVTLELDDATHEGRLSARGRDAHGGTRVSTTATFTVAEESPGTTTVAVIGNVDLSGKLASVVEAGATTVVGRLSAEFAENLATACGGAPVAAVAEAPEPVAMASSEETERRISWWRALLHRLLPTGRRSATPHP